MWWPGTPTCRRSMVSFVPAGTSLMSGGEDWLGAHPSLVTAASHPPTRPDARLTDMQVVALPITGNRTVYHGIGILVTAVAIGLAIAINPATLPLIAIGFLIFAPLEKLAPTRRHTANARTTFVNLAHLTITTTLTTALMAGALALLAFVPVLHPSTAWIGSLPAPFALLVVIVVGDTGYYWMHRATHTIPVLWRFHRIHHSSKELDWMAATRAHPVDQFLLHLGWLIPLRVLGAGTAWFVAYAVVLTVEPLLAHSNLNIKLPGLRWVIMTPEFHHWHHTAEPDAINKNFASQLPFLDALFGTGWLPARRRVSRYGLDEPVPEDYVGQLLEPARDLLRKRDIAPHTAAIG